METEFFFLSAMSMGKPCLCSFSVLKFFQASIEPLECGLDLVVCTPCDGIAEIKRYGTDHSIEMPYKDLPAHRVEVVLSAKLRAH